MEVTIDIDLEKFRYSLVGNGYLLEDVEKMSKEKLISVLEGRIYWDIEKEYLRSKEYGLLDSKR